MTRIWEIWKIKVYEDEEDECGCCDEDEDIIEVTCPNCDEVVYVNEDSLTMEDDEEE